jgi:hypothetical protein
MIVEHTLICVVPLLHATGDTDDAHDWPSSARLAIVWALVGRPLRRGSEGAAGEPVTCWASHTSTSSARHRSSLVPGSATTGGNLSGDVA